jgi:hypothetical protein
MELPDLSKLKLKVLTCKDCTTRSKKGEPYCYLRKEIIKLDQKACKSVTVEQEK